MTDDGAALCVRCDARNPPATPRCWVCYTPLATAAASRPPKSGISWVWKMVIAIVFIAMLIPMLLVVTCFGVLGVAVVQQERRGHVVTTQLEREMAQELVDVRQENPLAGEILAFERSQTPWTTLQATIANADAAQLSRPVEHAMFGGVPSSPLAMVLRGSHLEGSFDLAKTEPHFLDAARELIARGANLSPAEDVDVRLAWMAEVVARGGPLPDLKAAQENPFVWKLMTAPSFATSPNGLPIYEILHDHPEYLNQPTTVYGTPLRAALIRREQNWIEELDTHGARLSEAECKLPSLATRCPAPTSAAPTTRARRPSPGSR